jgi:hypothetical protein
MLTPERLSQVSKALAKLADAQDELAKLEGGEPVQQPPTDRAVVLLELERDVARVADRLEGLFA